MFEIFRKLFRKSEPQRVMSGQFGSMVFDARTSTWETEEHDPFHAVPGDSSGPSDSAVTFVQNKLTEIEKYWSKCKPDLEHIAYSYDSICKEDPIKKIFKVSALSVNSVDLTEWEICFESEPEYKWLYVGMHFSEEELVANDIST